MDVSAKYMLNKSPLQAVVKGPLWRVFTVVNNK